MKILVTGSNGFVGSKLVEDLVRSGNEVTALVRSTAKADHLKTFSKTGLLKFVVGNVTDFDSLKEAVIDQEAVIHCAGLTSALTRKTYFEVNVEGTRNLAEAVSKFAPRVKRFIYVSSLAAAGPAENKTAKPQASSEVPVSWYGKSKLEAEKALKKYFSVFPITVVRPPIIYGPRDRGVFEIIKSVNRRFAPHIRGNNAEREKFYSVVHVDDLSIGIQLLLGEQTSVSGDIFYFSENRVYSFREIVTAISEALEKKTIRFPMPLSAVALIAAGLTLVGHARRKSFPLNWDKLREMKPDFWICSPEKAQLMLGFQSKHELKFGMKATVQWYKDNQWL